VRVGDLKPGVLAQRRPALDVRVDRAALDRTGADQGHLHGQIIDVHRLQARQHLHLGPALDLEDTGCIGPADRLEGRLVGEVDPAEVHCLPADPVDLVDRALDRREHAEAEQVDLQEPGVLTGVLVPHHDLALFHRRRNHRADLNQRLGRDHHAA